MESSSAMPRVARPNGVRRAVAVGLVALAAAIGAAATNGWTASAADPSDPPVTGEPVKLNLTVASGGLGSWYQAEIDRFREARPDIEIAANVVEGRQWQETLKQVMAASDRPDVAYMNQGPAFIPPLAEAGLLVPMDDVLEESGLLGGGLSESTLDFHRLADGHFYGVPTSVTFGPALYVNKALFEQAGVELPESGAYETLDEFLDACQKFRAAGIQPLALGNKDQWPGNHTWSVGLQRSMAPEAFQALLANDGTVSYTSPEAQGAFDFIKALQDAGCFIDGANGLSYDDSRAQFVKGFAAMWQGLSSSYGQGDLLGQLPEDFDLGVMWYPQLRPDVPARVLYYPGHTVVVAAGEDEAKVNAAKDFAAFITSLDEQAAMPGLNVGLLPARIDIDPAAFEVIGPVMSTMYDQLADLGTADFYDVRAPTELSISLMYGLVQEVMTGTKTPAEAAQAMEDAAAELRQGA